MCTVFYADVDSKLLVLSITHMVHSGHFITRLQCAKFSSIRVISDIDSVHFFLYTMCRFSTELHHRKPELALHNSCVLTFGCVALREALARYADLLISKALVIIAAFCNRNK